MRYIANLSTRQFTFAVMEEFILCSFISIVDFYGKLREIFLGIMIGYVLHWIMHVIQCLYIKKYISLIVSAIITGIIVGYLILNYLDE